VKPRPIGEHGRRLADEEEKRGLEGIFGIVIIGQDTAADAPHHGGVTLHQGCKRHLVPAIDVVVQ
jgi:hypothetical protein